MDKESTQPCQLGAPSERSGVTCALGIGGSGCERAVGANPEGWGFVQGVQWV